MPGFLFTSTARWIGAALLVLVILGSVYAKGRHDVQVKFDQYKAEVAAIAAAQEEKTKAIEAKNKRINEETKNAYNTKLAALRTYYGMRNQGTGSMPILPYTPHGAAGYTPDNLPPVATLAAQCAETTLTLYTLQNWVKDVVQSKQ